MYTMFLLLIHAHCRTAILACLLASERRRHMKTQSHNVMERYRLFLPEMPYAH